MFSFYSVDIASNNRRRQPFFFSNSYCDGLLNGVEWAACLRSDKPVLAFSRGVATNFLVPHHEIHEPLPIFEKLVSSHRLKVLEKLLARSDRGANHLVARIGHLNEGHWIKKTAKAISAMPGYKPKNGDDFAAIVDLAVAFGLIPDYFF